MSQASKNSEPILKLKNFIKFSSVAWNFLQVDLFKETSSIEQILSRREKQKKSLRKLLVRFNIIALLSYTVNRILSCIPFKIEKFSFNISAAAAIFLSVIKYYNIIWNQQRITVILQMLPESYTKQECFEHGILKTFIKFRRFIRIYTVFMYLPYVQMFLGPILEYFATGQRIFPHHMTFWFDATSNLTVYLVAFAYCSYISILSRTTIVSNDKIFYGIGIVVSVEFRILKIKFSELKLMNETDAKIQLKSLVKRHQELILCAQEIQNIFSQTFFFNFIISSLFICFTGFHMSITDEIASIIIDILFCFFSLMNIFMQCYTGQMLRDASDSVIDGTFDCDWEMMKDVQMRKDLLFVMKRAQKGVQFMILNKWPVNIEQFASVSTEKKINFMNLNKITIVIISDCDLKLLILHHLQANVHGRDLKYSLADLLIALKLKINYLYFFIQN
jgi:hypothetical protein